MDANTRTRKTRTLFVYLAILAIGVAPLVNSFGNPRLAELHGPDVLQLTAIGFCAGLALGMFPGPFFSGRRSS